MSLKSRRQAGQASYILSMLLMDIQSLILHLEAFMSVRHALLALLSEGPKYGLQLREEFEANTGQVWPLNVGQVYTTLQRFERDGLVVAASDAESGGEPGPQEAYRITE